MFQFSSSMLLAYRAAVIDSHIGAVLAQILSTLESQRGYRVEGERYQRVPSGYGSAHPRADLLRFKGLAAFPPRLAIDVICSSQLIDMCTEHFAAMASLQ
jgi:Conserved hypothetical protein (DUF2461)